MVEATFHSTEVIDLNDRNDPRSGGTDHPQEVSIAPFYGGSAMSNNSKVIINMGEKDEIAYIAEAKVKDVEPLPNEKVKLSFTQAYMLNKVYRTIELIFPEDNLLKIYKNLDLKQQEEFQVALYENAKEGKVIKNSKNIPQDSALLQTLREIESKTGGSQRNASLH